jgi:hypothetical protein
MKTTTLALAIAAATTLCTTARAQLLGPEEIRTGDEAYVWNSKMTCGTTEQAVVRYGMWEGRLWSRTPGEKDRHLFNVVGINTRQCAQLNDPQRGRGYRSVSREIMVYLDPQTNALVDEWKNPWTGETVRVIHVANDPVNMRKPSFAIGEDGKPAMSDLRHYGDTLVSSSEIPLFYTNPLGGDYQDYVGNKYHAMEIFNTSYATADFIGSTKLRIGESKISWQRVSEFLPWMKMGGRPGLMIFNATGFSAFDKAKISPKLMEVLTTRFPLYLTPPPLDDARPNQTTWTITKTAIDAERAAAKPSP